MEIFINKEDLIWTDKNIQSAYAILTFNKESAELVCNQIDLFDEACQNNLRLIEMTFDFDGIEFYVDHCPTELKASENYEIGIVTIGDDYIKFGRISEKHSHRFCTGHMKLSALIKQLRVYLNEDKSKDGK